MRNGAGNGNNNDLLGELTENELVAARDAGNSGNTEDDQAIETNQPANTAAAIATIGGPIQVVRHLSLNDFRSKLVTHFGIAYDLGEVKWPARTGRRQPRMLEPTGGVL